tara:strand:+ start:224 stop:2083 length:1860 start_codon:yes stop_codon:yes gene_type:complete
MLTNIFENRNKKVTSILKLGDYLSRSLRSNVELFDLKDDTATFVTENNYIIQGKVDLDKGNINLIDIEVTPANLFSEGKEFDKFVSHKAMSFLKNLSESDYPETSCSFTDLIGLWETRLKFDKTVEKLSQKKAKFNEKVSITGEGEYKKLSEIKEGLVEFLKENKEEILSIPEIKNSVRFLNVLSTAFNFPKIDEAGLEKSGSYQIKKGLNESIYEVICKQELIKRELLEAKNNFDGAWASSPVISKLASKVYESDDDEILMSLGEAIIDIPYLSLSTKKSLTESFSKALDLDGDSVVPMADVKAFSSKIYEMKKPIRSYLSDILNEEYGISIQNLKEVPSFKDLVKTQVVIFETLSKISPKDSVQQSVLQEIAKMLSKKSGSESLDVSEDIHNIFHNAGYDNLLTEMELMNYLDFDKVAGDLGQIGDILRMLKQQTGVDGAGEQGMQPGMEQGMQPGMEPDAAPEMDPEQYDSDEMLDSGEEMPAQTDDDLDEPTMGPEDAAAEADSELEAEQEMGGEEGMEEDPTEVDKDDLLGNLSKLDALIQDLTSEISSGEEEMEDDMGDGEEDFEGEEEEDFEGEEEEDFDEDGESDVDVEEEEEPPKKDLKVKKKKPRPPFK